jgi:hypothetical protein
VFLPHESVAHLRSSIVLDRLKQTTRLPLRHLVDDMRPKTKSQSKRNAKRS